MTIDPGHFQLYPHLDPPLAAGTYRFTSSLPLTGTGPDGESLDAGDLGVASEQVHVEITSPRYLLPPDQVLSTYPPAEAQGAWGSRLPQVVIKRRTLPWERDVAADSTVPWLALVVFTAGEAEVRTAQPVADCVTPGVRLDGAAEVATANYLAVTKTMIDTIFPTRKDVPLLAHARAVDINDTELMMGDDDGFLAVVIANRLPLPARDATGAQVPTTYTAALISLEGQFEALRPDSPPRMRFSPTLLASVGPRLVSYATADHLSMGTPPKAAGVAAPIMPAAAAVAMSYQPATTAAAVTAAYTAGGWAKQSRVTTTVINPGVALATLVEHRFPVLLHWSFTTTGSTTFRSLMGELQSGLLGTVPTTPPVALRPPLEVAETGHVGLPHRTRSGEQTRAWYRGPLLAHPADERSPRLPLAHASDQLRSYIPDGREDLSLATAFEIGRLLALSSPSIIARLLAWRSTRYAAARATTIWADILADRLHLDQDALILPKDIGYLLGGTLVAQIAQRPGAVLGDPMEIFRRGEVPDLGRDPATVLNAGFATDLSFRGDLGAVLDSVRSVEPRIVPDAQLRPTELTGLIRNSLDATLTGNLDLRVRDTLVGANDPVFGTGGVFSGGRAPVIVLDSGPIQLTEATERLAAGDPQVRAALEELLASTADLDAAPGGEDA